MKITLLILVGFLVVALGSLTVMARKVGKNIETQYSQAAEEPLVDVSHLFAALVEQDIDDGEIDPSRFRESFASAYRRRFVARIYNLEKTTIRTHIYITDRDGIVVFDSDEGRREGLNYSMWRDVSRVWEGKYGARASRSISRDSQSSVFFIGAPIYHQGEIIGTLSVIRPETAMAPFADESRALVLRWTLVAGITTMVLGALWVYWLLHPIQKLTAHARSIATGHTRALPETGRAELRQLSVALEEMRHELAGKHYVENYVQALTHELKSPLAAIRGAAELIDESMPADKRERFLKNILAETGRSEELVRQMVHLASIENQAALQSTQSVALQSLVEGAIADVQGQLEARGISIVQVNLEEAPEVLGDRLMLGVALENLIKNAIDFSPQGSSIEIAVDDSAEEVSLTVRDAGPGLPDYAVGRVFERFYSLKNAETGRKSSGIGLCLAKEAMELHGGSVSLENHADGGAIATLAFPKH